MYVCQVCRTVVGPRLPLLRHVIYRLVPQAWGGKLKMRREVAQEIPVCKECKEDLDAGVSLRIMLEEHRGRIVTQSPAKLTNGESPKHIPILGVAAVVQSPKLLKAIDLSPVRPRGTRGRPHPFRDSD